MKPLALITGSSGGIGAATVSEFSKAGFEIMGVDQILKPNSNCDYFYQMDITDEKKWSEVSEQIDKKFGRLDVLINITGRNYFAPIENSELDQWQDMFRVNVLGMVAAIKHCTSLLRKADSPAIVNMSSISGYIGSVGYAAYCSTKGAVDSLTKSLALELAPHIRVNAIAPGWIETPFTLAGLEKSADPVKYRKSVEQMHALGRVGSPEEIAKSIYWLSSRNSSFMTGSVMIVDGGYMIKN